MSDAWNEYALLYFHFCDEEERHKYYRYWVQVYYDPLICKLVIRKKFIITFVLPLIRSSLEGIKQLRGRLYRVLLSALLSFISYLLNCTKY